MRPTPREPTMTIPAIPAIPSIPFFLLRVALLACASFAAAAAAPAPVRIGEAEVRAGPRGVPCFSISPREERQGTPDVQAVTVSDGKRLLWTATMPAERTFPLGFATCLLYGDKTHGGKLAALPRTDAEKLEPGRVYYLRIDARPGSATASHYEARFCLARQRDGSAVVHHIWADARAGKRLFGCLAPED
nr:hypothetical protein [uncultured Massilia sp.]